MTPDIITDEGTLPNGLPWPPTYDSVRFGASVPDTWLCVDCGWNTAPGFRAAQQVLEAFNAGYGVEQTFSDKDELYCVLDRVWTAAGMGGARRLPVFRRAKLTP